MTVSISPTRDRDQGTLQAEQRCVDRVHRPSRPEPQVRGHLVVARAPGVQLSADRTDPSRECHLEVEVHVLELRVPGERARGRSRRVWCVRPSSSARDSSARQQPRSLQPVDVRDRALDVIERELAGRPRSTARTPTAQVLFARRESTAPGFHRPRCTVAAAGSRWSATWIGRSLSIGSVQLQAEP